MVTTATWASLFSSASVSSLRVASAPGGLARVEAIGKACVISSERPIRDQLYGLDNQRAARFPGPLVDCDIAGARYVRLLPMLLKMFWSWPRRKIMATITAMAMTAIMSAYSTRP